MNLLYNNELSELKIGGRHLYLCCDSANKPDVVYGNENFRVSKAMIGYDNGDEIITDMVDVWDVKRQLDNVTLTDDQGYGNYTYIDWENEYVTIVRKNNKVKYKLSEAPNITSDNTEINVTIYPDIKELGINESGMFEYIISSKSGDAEVKLYINLPEHINSYIA